MPSVPVFEILTLTCGTQIILSTSGSIFQAANDTRSLLICGIFSSVLTVTGISVGIFVFDSLNAVAWSLLISFTLSFLQCYIWMYKVTFKMSMAGFWKQCISPIVLSLLMFVLLFFTSKWMDGWSLILTLIIKVLIFLVVLFLYIQITNEYNILGKVRICFTRK